MRHTIATATFLMILLSGSPASAADPVPPLATKASPPATTAPAKPLGSIGPPKGTMQWRFRSDKHQVALLELFSSQECNSCPPAEAWLAEHGAGGYGYSRLVPLTMPVSYWPHLGWTDRFANSRFMDRHRVVSHRAGLDGPYTPQFVLNGIDRQERGDALLRLIDRVNQRPPAINMEMLVEMTPARDRMDVFVNVDRSRVITRRDLSEVYVVVFERHLETKVTAGENAGKTLKQDWVARELRDPQDLPPDVDLMPMGLATKIGKDWKPENLGVVAYVQLATNGAVVQAVAGELTPGKATMVK